MLVSELPEQTTFLNTNTTLTPPSSIVIGFGSAFVNQTTLPSYYLGAFPVPFNVTEKSWHQVTASLLSKGTLSVCVDDQHVIELSLLAYYITGTFTGSFGFGAYQDQVARIRHVTVTASNGSTIYNNPMMSPVAVLAEYGAQANLAPVCLDGPKRDRLVWLGDFLHTARIIGVSTARHDLSQDTLQFLLDTQISTGELAINPAIGYGPTINEPFSYLGELHTYALEDYQFLGLDALYTYVQ